MRATTFLILFAFFFGGKVLAQGPDLLLQQYGKNAYDLEYYRKWNVDVLLQPHLSKPTNRESKAKLQLNWGAEVHYRSTKTFGISSGLHYHRINYAYAYENDNSQDRLTYLRVPLLLSVYPVKRLRISLGGSYQLFLNGKGQPPPATEATAYPKGTFLNTLGAMASAHYRVWRKFSASFGYHFQKKNTNPLSRETQNFSGFSFGIAYGLLNPNQSKR